MMASNNKKAVVSAGISTDRWAFSHLDINVDSDSGTKRWKINVLFLGTKASETRNVKFGLALFSRTSNLTPAITDFFVDTNLDTRGTLCSLAARFRYSTTIT